MNNWTRLLEQLYESPSQKTLGAQSILELALQSHSNIEFLVKQDALLSALVRVLREERGACTPLVRYMTLFFVACVSGISNRGMVEAEANAPHRADNGKKNPDTFIMQLYKHKV